MRHPVVLVGIPITCILVRTVPAVGALTVGRSKRCDLVVAHPSVSRHHAELSVRGEFVRVTDLGSTNGTFVDEERVANVADVLLGRHIRFGSVEFVSASREKDIRELAPVQEADNTPLLGRTQTAKPTTDGLSDAQRRVFDFLVDGLSEKRIAARLGISQCTVHNHISAIYRAFEVHSRSELLVRVLSRREVQSNSDLIRVHSRPGAMRSSH
jgi:DNA-binding CsgD family transcriptional regulator